MAITAGQPIVASDFVSTASGAGDSGKVAKLNASGLIPNGFLSQFEAQEIAFLSGSSAINSGNFYVCAASDYSALFVAYDLGGATTTILRLVKDIISGTYYITHSTTLSQDSGYLNGIACTSAGYLYVATSITSAGACRRYAIADLSGVTTMTITSNRANLAPFGVWSDGTNIYMINTYGVADVWRKYTISGTTMTNAATVTYTGAGQAGAVTSDGTSVWFAAAGSGSILKYPIAGAGSASATKTTIDQAGMLNQTNKYFFMPSANVLGVAFAFNYCSATAVVGAGMMLVGITPA